MRVNAVSLGAEGTARIGAEAEHAESDARKVGQPLGEARPSRPVTVFVPPPIFDEEQAVLNLPMPAHVSQKLRGADPIRVEAGEEVACVAEPHGAIIGNHIAVDANGNSAAGKGERVTYMSDVL